MSTANNKNSDQNPSQRGGRGTKLVVAGAILICAGVAWAVLLKKSPAAPVAVAAVQGSLINPPAPTNASSVAVAPVPTPVAPTPVVAVAISTSAAKNGEYLQIGFDKLAGFPMRLKWDLVDAVRIKGQQKVMGDLPADIKSLDQKKIAVRGFMLPVKLEDGLVTDFLLLRTQARCCYGMPIQMNELLSVHMNKAGVKSIMDQPITISGELHIKENHDDSGALTSIYTLDGDKMDGPSAL